MPRAGGREDGEPFYGGIVCVCVCVYAFTCGVCQFEARVRHGEYDYTAGAGIERRVDATITTAY